MLGFRITFVTHGLHGGGAERNLALLATELCKRGHLISIVIFQDEAAQVFNVSQEVHLIIADFNEKNFFASFRRNPFAFQSEIKPLCHAILSTSPDCVVSFVDKTNIMTLAALSLYDLPVLVSERSNPIKRKINFVWRLFRYWYYKQAQAIIMLAPETETWAKKRWPRCHIASIVNPVVVPPETRGSMEVFPNNRKVLVSLGRLHPTKGYDMLLPAFASICSDFSDWDLYIFGEGSQRADLEAWIYQRGLQNRIYLPGFVKDSYAILRAADLYVQTSRHEAFCQAIAEALSVGLPVVSFRSPFGPERIIRDGIDGLLVDYGNIKALAETLANLMANEDLRIHMGKNAPDILNRFSISNTVDAWEYLINEAIKNKKHLIE